MDARQFLIENNIITKTQKSYVIKDQNNNWVDMVGLFKRFELKNSVMENVVFKKGQRYLLKEDTRLAVECLTESSTCLSNFIGKVMSDNDSIKDREMKTGEIFDFWIKEDFISEIDYRISQVTVKEKLTQEERIKMHLALGAKSADHRFDGGLIVQYPLFDGGVFVIRFNVDGVITAY